MPVHSITIDIEVEAADLVELSRKVVEIADLLKPLGETSAASVKMKHNNIASMRETGKKRGRPIGSKNKRPKVI